MGFQDRQYYHEQGHFGGGHGGGQISSGMSRLSTVVKYLLIINCAVFLLQLIFKGRLEYLFAATGSSPAIAVQAWRLITFQFLHAAYMPFHLLFNMIGLYFLGPILERSWGPKRFLFFYLLCGAVGGLLFVLTSLLGLMSGVLLGASGGVLGLLVACAIMFPHIRVVVILFPMQIRTAAVLFAIFFTLIVLTGGDNAGGHLCHLGGMATGFVWVMGRPWFETILQKRSAGAYQRKIEQQQKIQYELDRILAKVHQQGIHSLSHSEKQILQKATEQQKGNPDN